jgi:hypothetical protein
MPIGTDAAFSVLVTEHRQAQSWPLFEVPIAARIEINSLRTRSRP